MYSISFSAIVLLRMLHNVLPDKIAICHRALVSWSAGDLAKGSPTDIHQSRLSSIIIISHFFWIHQIVAFIAKLHRRLPIIIRHWPSLPADSDVPLPYKTASGASRELGASPWFRRALTTASAFAPFAGGQDGSSSRGCCSSVDSLCLGPGASLRSGEACGPAVTSQPLAVLESSGPGQLGQRAGKFI